MSTEADIVEKCVAFVTEQSAGEWDDKTIRQDAEKLAAFVRAERDAAARDMRERAAMAVRNKICTIPWPPEDGYELIDTLMAVVRALPDTPAVIATEGDNG